jgi:endonuclease I
MQGRSLKYLFIIFCSWTVTTFSSAQPAGYYATADGLKGVTLQQALHEIIDNNTELTYGSLWTHFQTTDKKTDGTVWDMYSDIPSGTPSYTFTFVTNQCGNYSGEGNCYNREHSFPNSWFGGEVYPMYSDLFHLYPTDGWVNNKRENYPFGVTTSPTWTSTNGSKLGPFAYTGYTGIVFEPINGYKGDFARSYFYMAVRYYGEDSGWPGSDMVTGSQLKPWALKMLMEWDIADPVSLKERDRNEAVYLIQGNRNPFIDNPLYSDLIWGTQSGTEDTRITGSLKVWPNPANGRVTVELPDNFQGEYALKIVDISGRKILDKLVSGQPVILDVTSFNTGYYILIISGNSKYLTAPLIVSH